MEKEDTARFKRNTKIKNQNTQAQQLRPSLDKKKKAETLKNLSLTKV